MSAEMRFCLPEVSELEKKNHSLRVPVTPPPSSSVIALPCPGSFFPQPSR